MTDLKLDVDTGDLVFENGSFVLCETKEELISQQIYITIHTNRGTWRHNVNFGIPWIVNENNGTQLLSKALAERVENYVRQSVLEREGVESISNVVTDIDRENRKITIRAEPNTESGPLVFETSIALGQLNNVLSEILVDINEMIEYVHSAFKIREAKGEQLDHLSNIHRKLRVRCTRRDYCREFNN